MLQAHIVIIHGYHRTPLQHFLNVQRFSAVAATAVPALWLRGVQVQVWDTQDEDSMDPLLNISDGFDAQVRVRTQRNNRTTNMSGTSHCVTGTEFALYLHVKLTRRAVARARPAWCKQQASTAKRQRGLL
jgi:hypothetical protein